MATGENNRDLTALEKQAGQKAARTLARNLKTILATATTKQTGTMLRAAGANAVVKFDALDHIAIKATSATFKQHYGFEGIKSNGVAMQMKPFNHFTHLFKSTNALEKLIDEIGALRMEQITSKIKF